MVAIGEELAGYRLRRAIGEGGMAIVYLAERVSDGEEVVLKVLREELSEDGDFRKRFLRESRYATSLDHPNVVKVLDSGEADGVLYIAMEYIEGTDLYALLEEEAPLEPALTIAILSQVGAGIDAAHAEGVLHRDVKPGNVLIAGALGDSPRSLLTDFGLSKHTTKDSVALTATGSFVGTIAYTAPEQMLGSEPGPAADVYSLGCLLYECLTGHAPFSGTEVEMMQGHIQAEPPKLAKRRSGFSPELDVVIRRALAKDPAERHGSCAELVQAAASALDVARPAAPAAETADLRGRLELLVTAGRSVGDTIPTDEELVLGRADEGLGALGQDPEISRRHARISRGPTGGLTIDDLGSTNGTYLNGRRLAATQTLCPGDEIELGATKLRVQAAAPAEPEVAVSLRVELDFAGGSGTICLGGDGEAARLVLESGRWHLDATRG